MRKILLTTLLVVLMFLSSGVVVKPALGVDLDAYARAIADNVNNQDGPRQGWALAQAGSGNSVSWSDIHVQRVGGMAWGPMGGWYWSGIGAMVAGFVPPGLYGNAYAEGWFESDGIISPFTISTKGASCGVRASGYTASGNSLGIIVTDGGAVIYEVAVEWGWSPETGTYFLQIGPWPALWQVQQDFYNLRALQPAFAIPFFPAGLARAKLYSHIHAWAASVPFVAQDGSNLQQDEVSGSFEVPPCSLIQDHGAPAYCFSLLSEGDKVAKYFDPGAYCTTPVYPYKVHDVDILLYDFAGVGSVDLRIGVNLESPDSCDGPGTQIYLSDPITVTTFYPSMAHIDLPDVVCVYEPFFIVVEWASGTPGSTPSFFMEGTSYPCDTCHAWMWYDGYSPPWWEWNDFWSPPVPGCPIVRVSGYTESPVCQGVVCDTVVEQIPGGQPPTYVWKNPSRYGDRYLNERFQMPLNHGGRLEKLDITFYQTGSTGTPNPKFWIWLSDGLYPLDNNPPYQAIAEFQIAYSDIVWYPGMTTVETYSHGITFNPGEMFHIGFGHAYNPGDTLIVLSDGSNNSNRSIEWRLPGQWGTLLADWGYGVDFMIDAYICPSAPEESTFVMSCAPPNGLASPGDVDVHVFDVTTAQIMNYPIPVTLSLLSVTPAANITANFVPNDMVPPFTSAVDITVAPAVPFGDYTLTFQGVGYDNQTKTCNVTLRVQPPYDEAMVQFYHGMQRATNFGAVGNDQKSATKTKKHEFHEFLEKTPKFQTISQQGNFVWYGTNYLFDGSFVSAVPGTPQEDHIALDVFNCEHVGFIPTQHLVVYYDPLYNANIAYANFYTEEEVISCEYDSLFIVGIMQECVGFSIKIKISYNPTVTAIPQLYTGLYEDWDIGDPYNNWVGMDTLHNLIYQWDVVDPAKVFGIFKAPFYEEPMFNMTAVSNPRFASPGFCSAWGLDSLWWLMTRPGYYNTAPSDTDISLLAVPQPFALNPGEKHIEIWIDFGRNLNDGLTWETWWHEILRYVGFYRGDMNADNTADIGDVLYIINYLFRGGPEPLPYVDQGDVNGDRIVNIGDILYLINYMFKSGAPPIDYVRFIEQFWSRPSLFTNPLWR